MTAITSILLGTDKKVNSPRVFTGLKIFDESTGGLRGGNTYLLAGLEKSGKTSLLLNWLSYNLEQNKKITFISTEMSLEEVVKRIASIRGIEINFDQDPKRLKLNKQLEENLNFIPIDDLLVEGDGVSVKQTVGIAERAIWEGADMVVVDNLTTFMSQETADNKATVYKIGAAVSKMINLAKVSDVPIIIVVHIKPSTTYKETPEGMTKIAKSDDPLKIFEESLTMVRRPSLNDVYGGGGVMSQLSGAILLWRPFQKFDKDKLKNEGMIIIDSMRHSESGVDIRVKYDGKTGKFEELISNEEWIKESML